MIDNVIFHKYNKNRRGGSCVYGLYKSVVICVERIRISYMKLLNEVSAVFHS